MYAPAVTCRGKRQASAPAVEVSCPHRRLQAHSAGQRGAHGKRPQSPHPSIQLAAIQAAASRRPPAHLAIPPVDAPRLVPDPSASVQVLSVHLVGVVRKHALGSPGRRGGGDGGAPHERWCLVLCAVSIVAVQHALERVTCVARRGPGCASHAAEAGGNRTEGKIVARRQAPPAALGRAAKAPVPSADPLCFRARFAAWAPEAAIMKTKTPRSAASLRPMAFAW